MSPAITANIPIYIRNTFEPELPGTRIYKSLQSVGIVTREKSVCGFSTVDRIALMNIEGNGMLGVPSIAHKLFGAFKAAGISVMFIAQASSEQSICVAFKESYLSIAKQTIDESFFYEIRIGTISKISEITDCSIIAAVGERMSNMPGVSGIFFAALGTAKINVLSMAQGCNERNISAVVHGRDAARALRAVHAAFCLSRVEIDIGVVGIGRVGSAVIQSIIDQIAILNSRFGLNLKIRAIANSKKMLLGDRLSETLKHELDFFLSPPRVTAAAAAAAAATALEQPPVSHDEKSQGSGKIMLEDLSLHLIRSFHFLSSQNLCQIHWAYLLP